MNKQYKARFIKLAKDNIKRDGINELLASLEKTDFFTAPASTRFHDSEEGGLCKHSLSVFDHLTSDLKDKFYDMESIALVSLFHDVCKVNYYTIEMRNKKDENGKWISVPFYSVDDKFPLGHGEKSIVMIMDKMKLKLEEMMAIRWHMCGFEPKENYTYLSKAMSEFPLIIHLHSADLKASYIQ